MTKTGILQRRISVAVSFRRADMERVPTDQSESIYLPLHPYGFRINIAHPRIAPLYERFRRWKGIPYGMPLSDDERFEFESYIIRKVNDK